MNKQQFEMRFHIYILFNIQGVHKVSFSSINIFPQVVSDCLFLLNMVVLITV